jgi:DNA-binding transcriptional MerR regulator
LTNNLSKGCAVNIRDLIRLTAIPERQVRYLIAEGFVPAPRGGRANADYGDDHVAAIRRYVRLRDLGFPPAAIKLLLQAKEGVPLVVAPGVTLVVDPNLIGSGAESGPLVERIKDLLADLLKEQTSNDVDRAANQD